MVFLHGILGTKNNWRSIARAFTAARPEWAALLVDLPEHGDAPRTHGPHTVEACARAIGALETHVEAPIRGMLGHSFGGKVALTYSETHSLDELWLIDSNPAASSPNTPGLTDKVIRALRSVVFPVNSTEAFVAELKALGIATAVGHWLAMNLRSSENGQKHWGLNLDAIDALIADYRAQDLFPVLETSKASCIQVVIGDRSEVWQEADLKRLPQTAHLKCHRLDTGHWVHVEAPEDLSLLLASPPRM